MIKERSNNRQLFINMLMSLLMFIINTGISFFLTPFVVSKLGPDAYGFIGLTNTIIGYFSLATIALNAMSSRFIAISYNQGDFETASRYYSSVFYANLFLSIVVVLCLSGCTIWLEYLINIPNQLLWDVKLLFVMLAFCFVANLIMSIYGNGFYIKNRLDISNILSFASTAIRLITLLICFGIFAPHVWYMGLTGVLSALVILPSNYHYSKVLIPEICIKRAFFEWKKIQELITVGLWNLLVKIGDLLANGIDLLFANIFIGSEAMGVFAITKTIPMMIQGLVGSISGVFGPALLQRYSFDGLASLIPEFKKTIRILSFISIVPLCVFYVFGKEFYSLWLPTQDAQWLYILSLVATSSMALWLPLEGLWQIFTIVNKVRFASIAVIINNGLTFIIALVCMIFVESPEIRLLVLAGTKNVIKFFLTITFLPIYTSKCLQTSITTFYPDIIKVFSCFVIMCAAGGLVKHFVVINSWLLLISNMLLFAIVFCVIIYCTILTTEDRLFIKERTISKILNKI